MKKIASVLAIAALAACGGPATQPTAGGSEAGCMTRAYSSIGGPFSLIDQTGAPVTQDDFKGRATMVFFGFTYCPDVCPTTLVTLNQAYAQMPEGVEVPRTVLISVDPERDTPDALASYLSVDAFPENMVGLTGSDEAIAAVADNFRAGYERVDMPQSAAGYTMDHTSLLYLMDEDWSLKTFFTHGDTPDRIASCLAEHLG